MTNILHQLEAAEDDANLTFLRSEVARLQALADRRGEIAVVERIGDDWRAQLDQAATEIERLRLAVRELLDGVNARCPDKNPREWTCPHMAALDRLVPPVDDERHDATGHQE